MCPSVTSPPRPHPRCFMMDTAVIKFYVSAPVYFYWNWNRCLENLEIASWSCFSNFASNALNMSDLQSVLNVPIQGCNGFILNSNAFEVSNEHLKIVHWFMGRQTTIQSYKSADCSTKVTGTFTAVKSKKNSNFTYGNNNFLFYNFASLITILFCWWCN